MKKIGLINILLLAVVLLSACNANPPSGSSTPGASSATSTEPAATATSFIPPETATGEPDTPTPVPLALSVNGEDVTLDDFNAAVQRFHAGFPEVPTEEALERVRQDHIDQILLAQAAYQTGFILDDATLQGKLDSAIEKIGGQAAFTAWQDANLYTPERFDREFRRAIAAAWMRDQVIAAVPASAEQVRARPVRVNTRGEAEAVLESLNSGTTFDIMVQIYDPIGLGELGWFPRGYLLEPAIEEAAFGMEVGEVSGVIESGVGFHIIQVTDRQDVRPLDPDAHWALQQQALTAWLDGQSAGASIEIYGP